MRGSSTLMEYLNRHGLVSVKSRGNLTYCLYPSPCVSANIGGSNRNDRQMRTCNLANQSPRLIDSNRVREKAMDSSFLAFMLFFSHNMSYERYRDDPIFPATSPFVEFYDNDTSRFLEHFDDDYDERRKIRGHILFVNQNPLPTVVGCIHNSSICSSERGECWNYLETPVSRLENLNPQARSNHLGESANAAGATDAELAQVLLSNALMDTTDPVDCTSHTGRYMRSNIMDSCSSTSYNPRIEFESCYGLPFDQWKAEVRVLFEASLAGIQFNVLNIVRGENLGTGPTYERLAPNLRGLCTMGKFKSVGWRNVSVWGLFGCLSFAAGISLASIKTEDDELWLLIWARLLIRAILGIYSIARTVPWRTKCTRITCSVCMMGKVLQTWRNKI